MQLRKRIVAGLILVALGAGVLWASTREWKTDDADTVKQSVFDRKETIYFWYDDENLSGYVNGAAVSFAEKENIRVIPVLTSASEYLEAINQASLDEEQTPDAYMISHDSLEKAYMAGLAIEIDDVKEVCDSVHFPAAALNSVTYHNKKIAYPLSFETSALIYNEDYLAEWAAQTAQRELILAGEDEDEPTEESTGIEVDAEQLAQLTEMYFQNAIPQTLDDILTIADTLDAPAGVEGVMKWDVTDIFYNYWIVGNYLIMGGDAGDDESNISVNNPETVKCLERYKELNQFFSIEANTVNYESVVQDFMEGKTVFTIATTDVVAKLEEARAEGTLGFNYGVATLPRVSEELDSRSMSVTNVIAINGYSEHQEAANRFAAYLVDGIAGELYEKTGSVAANLMVNDTYEALQIFRLEYAESVPLPKMMQTGNYWLLLERLFAKVWNDEEVLPLVQELDIMISAQMEGR